MSHLAVNLIKVPAGIGSKGKVNTFLQVLHLGGTPYSALTQRQDPEVSFDFDSQRKAFKKLYADALSPKRFGKPTINDLTGEVPRSHLMSMAQSISENRMFLSDVSELGPEKIAEARKKLMTDLNERGHLVEQDPSPTLRIHQEASGQHYLSCHPAYLKGPDGRGVENTVLFRNTKLAYPVRTTFGTTGHEARIDFEPGMDVPGWAAALEAEGTNRKVRLVNHTPQPFLHETKGNLKFSSPYLVSAEQGVELFLTHGNFQEVENLVPSTNYRNNDRGFLMRGSPQELAAIYTTLHRADADGRRYIPERKRLDARAALKASEPTPVAFCDPKPFLDSRLNDAERITPRSIGKADSYQLDGGHTFTEKQRTGVAWCSQIGRMSSLLADDTGGGKTIQMAAAADISTAAKGTVLVVAPVGVLSQWIREIYDKIPVEGKHDPDPLRPHEIARWMKKLGKDDKRAVHDLDAYAAIRHRFRFIPISSMECGLRVVDGRLEGNEGGPTTEQVAAKREIDEELSLNPETMIIDELQGFRRDGDKFGVLMAIRKGNLNGRRVRRVIAGSATPIHHDAPDLGNYLNLFEEPGFDQLAPLDFARTFCDKKHVFGANGWTAAKGTSIYDYSGFKTERLGEIGKCLAGNMLSRGKADLFPGRFKPIRVFTPVYQRDDQHGVQLEGFHKTGTLVAPTPAQRAEIDSQNNPIKRVVKIAEAKVPTTVARVQEFLKDPAKRGEKVVVWTNWEESHGQIVKQLSDEGVALHQMTGTPSSWRDSSGSRHKSKVALMSNFMQSPDSRVIVATLGAGSTGLDGLQYVVSTAIINDFSTQPGVQIQAMGRHSRGLFRPDYNPQWEHADVQQVLLDHPVELDRYDMTMKRAHLAYFTTAEGLIGELDSDGHEMKALVARHNICRDFAADGLHFEGQKGVRGQSVALSDEDSMRLDGFRNEFLEVDTRMKRDGLDVVVPAGVDVAAPRSDDISRAEAARVEAEASVASQKMALISA
jgi:hypothetical protein